MRVYKQGLKRGLPKREHIEEVVIRPKLSLDEADKKFKGRYLSHDDYDIRPTKSLWGKFADGGTAFIYLTDALPEVQYSTTDYAVHHLKFNDVKNSRRAGLKQSKGGELVLGYVNFPYPRAAANTYKQWEEYSRFGFLIQWIGAIVHAYLPEYHAQQLAIAREQMDYLPYMDLHKERPAIKGLDGKREFKLWKKWLRDPEKQAVFPIFSALQINKSTLFRSHADAKNEGGFACLTAFGKWAGGEFCLPRLRVAFPLQPGSVLIADNNNEQHGNIGPLVGNRISVVAYLRSMKAKTKVKAAGAGR